MKKNEKNFKKNNENDIVCETINSENCDEPSFKKKFLLVNQSPSPSISTENKKNENEENNNSIDILDLNDAIRELKECILLIKGYNSYNKQIYDTLKPLIKNEVIDLQPLFNKDNDEEEKEKEDNNKQYSDIYDSAYLNLIFCLIRAEYYNEAIEFIEEFKESNNSSEKYKFVLENYLIEAYLKLGKFQSALNILSKDNYSYENMDIKGSFFSNSNHQIYNEIAYRMALYINLIKINIMNNNFQEAKKYIISVLNLLNNPNEKELPPYVINIIIFYFLSMGKNEEAVQIIKFRKIPKFYNN